MADFITIPLSAAVTVVGEAPSYKDWLGKTPVTRAENARDLSVTDFRDDKGTKTEPFMDGRYQIKKQVSTYREGFGGKGKLVRQGFYTVYDGSKPIASMCQGSVVVQPKYRRMGIGTALAAEFMKDFPEYRPSSVTQKSKRMFERAWDQNKYSHVVKTAISLPEIVRQTNQFSKKYRGGCSPRLLDSNPQALFLHYNVKCNKEDSDPAGHDVRVQFDVTKIEETQNAKDLDIQVQCSCPAFLYWGAQWNLHQRDGLLGPARPALQAPKERLDLRGNYVICKHIHAVFERILPSVQHNIVNILRKREVERKKDELNKTPERLREEQEKMKERKQKTKVRETEDEATKKKLLDALREEEEARLLHEEELEDQAPEAVEVQRTEPATEPHQAPAPAPAPEKPQPQMNEFEAIEDLTQNEEQKIEQLHKQHKPHLHKGLPYEETEEEEGWQGERLSSKQASESGAGLLFRSPESPDRSNDYDPSWDYEIDENPDPELAAMATKICQGIYQNLKSIGVIDKWMFGFEVWAVKLASDTVATYIHGTYDFAVVLIDLEKHRGYEDQIGQSIRHELKHAEQDSRRDPDDEENSYDEDEAEYAN